MKYEKFEDWYDELEMTAFRSERFAETLGAYLPPGDVTPALIDYLERWLRAAFECGQKGE